MKGLRSPFFSKNAAQYLRKRKYEISTAWETRVRHQLPAATGKPSFIGGKRRYLLTAFLPQLIDEIASALDRSLQCDAIKELVRSHAAQLSACKDFSLEQVQFEYLVFRQVLFEMMEKDLSLEPWECTTILEYIFESRLAVSDEFMRIARQKVAQTEERLTFALDSARMGVFDWDLSTGKLNWSETLKKIWGVDSSQFSGNIEDFWAHMHPDDRSRVNQAIRDAFHRDGFYQAEFRILWPDQSIHWLSGRGRAQFDQNGRVMRLSGIAIDVTERRQMVEALRESENRLRLVTDSIPQIIWIAAPDASLHYLNENWYKYSGLTQGKGEGFAWKERIHPDDLEMSLKKWEEAQLTRTTFVVEHRLRRYDGEYRWFLVRAEPLNDDTGKIKVWFGSSTDIEEQKRIQQALEQEREMREQFVSMLSHDLRNPLSAALTNTQTIARYPDRTDRIPMIAEKVVESIERADQMIQDLLDANRIRAGKGLSIVTGECDLVSISKSACEDLRSIYGDRFECRWPETLKGYWSCKELQRLMENLMTNGIKYGDPTKKVSLGLSDEGRNVRISVHNFGNPIPPEEQKRLFEPFVRSKSAESGEQKGWGLGLTLVRGVVEAHGGKIRLESQSDRGTTFTVDLPKNREIFQQ
jgi:PAS domain S-box-containing protein